MPLLQYEYHSSPVLSCQFRRNHQIRTEGDRWDCSPIHEGSRRLYVCGEYFAERPLFLHRNLKIATTQYATVVLPQSQNSERHQMRNGSRRLYVCVSRSASCPKDPRRVESSTFGEGCGRGCKPYCTSTSLSSTVTLMDGSVC